MPLAKVKKECAQADNMTGELGAFAHGCHGI
jgi:hypothetical protein